MPVNIVGYPDLSNFPIFVGGKTRIPAMLFIFLYNKLNKSMVEFGRRQA